MYVKTTLIKMNLLRERKGERKNYQPHTHTQKKIKSENKDRMVVVDMLKIVFYYYLFLLIS